MASTAQVRLVDGPADGETITVELDVTGRPSLTHHWLGGRDLGDAHIYELETTGAEGPWLYRWRGPAS